MALDMVDWTAAFVNPDDARKIRVRLGINTGMCGDSVSWFVWTATSKGLEQCALSASCSA